MAIITIPKILQEKLTEEGADALVHILDVVEERSQSHTLEIAEGRFEKRLITEAAQIRTDLKSDIAGVEVRLSERIGSVKAELKEDIAGAEVRLSERIGNVKTELKEESSSVEAELREEIAGVEVRLSERIGSVKAELKEDIATVRADLRITEERLGKRESGT